MLFLLTFLVGVDGLALAAFALALAFPLLFPAAVVPPLLPFLGLTEAFLGRVGGFPLFKTALILFLVR